MVRYIFRIVQTVNDWLRSLGSVGLSSLLAHYGWSWSGILTNLFLVRKTASALLMLFAPLCRCPFLGRHLPVGMSNAQQETKPTTTSTNFFKRTHTNSLTSSVAKIKTLKENNKRNEKRVSRQRVLHTL